MPIPFSRSNPLLQLMSSFSTFFQTCPLALSLALAPMRWVRQLEMEQINADAVKYVHFLGALRDRIHVD